MKQIMLTGFSRAEIEQKIDAFLADKKPFTPVDLILPVGGSPSRFDYRGLSVREWHVAGNVRYDAAVEMLD